MSIYCRHATALRSYMNKRWADKVGDSQSDVIGLCECVWVLCGTHTHYILIDIVYIYCTKTKGSRLKPPSLWSCMPVFIPQVAIWHEHSIISVNIAKYHIRSFVHLIQRWPPPLRRFIPPGVNLPHDGEFSP